MVAAPAEIPETAPEAAPVAYNWETQSAESVESEDERIAISNATFCYAPKYMIDDWTLC